MYSTLGAPSGAFGCSYGPQSGTESRTSMLMTPLNGLAMVSSLVPADPDPDAGASADSPRRVSRRQAADACLAAWVMAVAVAASTGTWVTLVALGIVCLTAGTAGSVARTRMPEVFGASAPWSPAPSSDL